MPEYVAKRCTTSSAWQSYRRGHVDKLQPEPSAFKQGALKETQAIDMKFHNEKMQRLQDEQYATLKIAGVRRSTAGLTGVPKIQAEKRRAKTDADLYAEPRERRALHKTKFKKGTQLMQQEGDQQIAAGAPGVQRRRSQRHRRSTRPTRC